MSSKTTTTPEENSAATTEAIQIAEKPAQSIETGPGPQNSECTGSKRSSNVIQPLFRKAYKIKPIALGVSSVFLAAACSDSRQEAMVFTSLNDCKYQMPEHAEQCEIAYQQALQDAAETAPKFGSRQDCEYDFGAEQCVEYRGNGGNSWFMPLMAGYMIRDLLEPRRYSQPLFTSYSRYSPYRYRWIGADGYDFGDFRQREFRVSKTYNKPPKVNRTIKRGGFGSSVRAKSSWGSSKGGWSSSRGS